MDESAKKWMGIAIAIAAMVFFVFTIMYGAVDGKVTGSGGYQEIVDNASVPSESDPSGGTSSP